MHRHAGGLADGHQARVNDRTLARSFILAPDQLSEDWAVAAAGQLSVADLAPALEQNPAVFILGTGERQRFVHPKLTAALTMRRIGVECMDSQAACRTYNILMGENRRVLAAMVL